MCGVYFRKTFTGPTQLEDFDKLNLSRTLHRGPDSSLLVDFEKNIVGFNRLGIRDLLGGFQPYTGIFNEFIACINGELFNQEIIEKKLISEFAEKNLPSGDMQIMAEFVYRFGEFGLSEIDGMFAGFIFKPLTNTLMLFRDKAGEKPLYFKLDSDGILVASEIRSLLSTENVFNFQDSRALVKGYWAGTTCCYSGITKVPAGTLVEINLDSKDVIFRKYWNWSSPKTGRLKNARENHILEIAHSLSESVRNQLVADVPIALFLSGGLDSAVVLGLSKRHTDGEIDSLTLDFEDSQFSESYLASKTANYFGSKHTVIDLSSRELADLIPEVLNAMDTPILDPACIGIFALSKFAKDLGFKVALSGDGGDELFRGYNVFNYTKYMSIATLMPTFSKTFLRLLVASEIGKNKYLGIHAFADRLLDVIHHSDFSIPEIALSPLSGSSLIQELDMNTSKSGRKFFSTNNLNIEFEKYYREQILPELYLVKSDRMSMFHSIELRNPLLDGEILRKVSNLNERGIALPKKHSIISSVLGNDFPSEVKSARKRGFGIPITAALSQLDEPEWNLNVLGIKNESAANLWNRTKKGDASQTHALWALIVLNHFMNK